MDNIIVYYQQQWLPDLEGVVEYNNFFGVKTCREVEVILEPQILSLCLLRKQFLAGIVFKPCLYDSFYDGLLPASIVNSSPDYSAEVDVTNDGPAVDHTVEEDDSYTVLRNERLIRHLVKVVNVGTKVNSTELHSDFALYRPQTHNTDNSDPDADEEEPDDHSPKGRDEGQDVDSIKSVEVEKGGKERSSERRHENTGKNGPPSALAYGYLKNEVIVLSYIYSHLRHCILYLIWVHPLISKFTLNVVLNSEPFIFGFYTFLRKRAQVRKGCSLFGYSTLENTMRDLRFILHGVRRSLLEKYYIQYPLNDVCWFEGYVFSNLSVLFSLPCQDLDCLLAIHEEFGDLKSYCMAMNSRYDVVALKPPFLAGNEFATSEFNPPLSVLLNKLM